MKRAATAAEARGENDMGMSANVLAIGRFSTGIVGYLEYPARFYADTRDGAPMIRILFRVYEGNGRSHELAACFGIEPWDFNRHELDAAGADVPKLRALFGGEEVAAFEALRDAGFTFYFQPNG